MKQESVAVVVFVVVDSTASASLDDHVVIVFEDDFVVLVDVEHRDGRELSGYAAGAWHGARIDRMNQRLDDGVIRRVEMVWQRKWAVAVAVVSVVAGRRHDPVIPAYVAKVDVEGLATAIVPSTFTLVLLLGRPLTPRSGLPVVRVRH